MAHAPAPWHHDGIWIRDAGGLGLFKTKGGLAVAPDIALATAAPTLLAALKLAESFMAGFEGDELQDGIDERLATMRAAIAAAEPLPQDNPMPAEWQPPAEDEATLDAQEHADERRAWMAEQEAEWRDQNGEGE